MSVQRANRILCVEDDPDTCRLVGAVLPDFEIISADTVKQAWQYYVDQKFSLIITDYHLADGNGLVLCERIREKDYLTPIVVISGDVELTEAAVKIAGAQKLITKGSVTFLDDLFSSASLLHVT